MKKLIAAVSLAGTLFAMSSCASLSQNQTKAYYTACIGFNSVVQEATNAISTGKLSKAKALKLQPLIDSTAKLCEGRQPTNSIAIIDKIDKATKTIAEELSR
ncbi:MAG: hypothetical protein QXJ93_01060 [Candidatus Rehaiarchaeum fermentans]|nr:hypothetical protein [Candidatus Rehaiarchaeum fermentans]